MKRIEFRIQESEFRIKNLHITKPNMAFEWSVTYSEFYLLRF